MGRPRSDIAPRIIAAARQRFLVHGVDGASLREIARDARTSVGMVHYYFKSKDELFLATIEEDYARLLAMIAESLAGDAPFPDRVKRLYARLSAMTDREVTVIRLVLREVLVSTDRRRAFFERSLRGHIPIIMGAILEARAVGALDERFHPMVQGLSLLLLGLLPQMFVRLAAMSFPSAIRPPKGDELAAQLARLVLRGMAR